jgi:hypothetical protein
MIAMLPSYDDDAPLWSALISLAVHAVPVAGLVSQICEYPAYELFVTVSVADEYSVPPTFTIALGCQVTVSSRLMIFFTSTPRYPVFADGRSVRFTRKRCPVVPVCA